MAIGTPHTGEAAPSQQSELLVGAFHDMMREHARWTEVTDELIEKEQRQRDLLHNQQTGAPLYPHSGKAPAKTKNELGRLSVDVAHLEWEAKHPPAAQDGSPGFRRARTERILFLSEGRPVQVTRHPGAPEDTIVTEGHLSHGPEIRQLETIKGRIIRAQGLMRTVYTRAFEPTLTLSLGGLHHRRQHERFAHVTMLAPDLETATPLVTIEFLH